MAAREPAKTVQKIRIELDIFSGRQNPSWELTEKEATEMVGQMENLPSAPLQPDIPGLGYRGFIISNPGRIAGLPVQIRVYSGVLIVTEKGSVKYFNDVNNIENWLIGKAREHNYGEIINETIKNKFNS